MRPRFTIAGLLALVAASGVAFAALRHADEPVASLIVTGTLLALGVASLGAAFRRGKSRAYLAGIAAFGWGYMILALGPGAEESLRPRLLTTRLLDGLYPALNPDPGGAVRIWDSGKGKPLLSVSPDGRTVMPLGSESTTIQGLWGYSSEPFQDVGHSVTASILALLGGMVARAFAARSERERPGEV
ncbi:hypothetical protein [Tautonia plasticadhaerens]|uniref:Uncharacterized protein n=1 Tax=Tautonia plasticadhaerens TaxID=2527974 RepID=A0A518H3A3_9BACT|nr:hypothetical protein [Tautonia plasticadhaerens]QDV35325.1 hypothetical protein ElP_32280 [Tautonia plasticadhaerens]